MRLALRLDPSRLRRWHLDLAERLARRARTTVTLEWAIDFTEPSTALALLCRFESLVYGVPAAALEAVNPAQFAPFAAEANEVADLVIDLTSSRPRAGEPTWHVTFDGRPGEAAAVGALTRGRRPVVAVRDARTGVEIVSGHPGVENGLIMVLAAQDVLARTATLLRAAIDGAAPRHVGDRPYAVTTTPWRLARFAAKSLLLGAVGSLYRLCFFAPHWRVGWRVIEGPDMVELCAHPARGWRELPDDGVRFYADPFPIEKDGKTYVFVEEFDHRIGRGVISVVELDERGPVGTPRPVLDTGSHLSYPSVFEHAGDMWMVPESCTAASVDLYRATQFPDRWVKEITLVAGIVASDATLFEHDGRWWMLATVQDGGSFSDALHVWSAPALRGPWRPHRHNPVLVDAASARPAGRVVRRDGKLIRPFQDCRGRYGAAIGLAEIIRLDDEAFEQRVEGFVRPGPLWPGRRLHTINRAGRFECIDGSAWAPRFRPLARRRPAALVPTRPMIEA